MTKDKAILNIIPFILLVALPFAFLIPIQGYKWLVSLILVLVALISYLLIKKRNILSINKNQVILILAIAGILFVMCYYLTGLSYGFYRTLYPLSLESVFTQIIPIVVAIIAMEKIRYVIVAQNKILPSIIIFIALVLAEFILLNDFRNIETIKGFMSASAIVFLPAITGNLLFHYLVKRYGCIPNILYKLITTLYLYFISFVPGTPDLLFAFAKLLFPLVIYAFIDYLYEYKVKFAIKKGRTWGYIGTTVLLLTLVGYVGLISGSFDYGVIVVGSGSMTGALNKGDVVVYQEYKNQTIQEGQIIVFEKNDSVIIHRVVDIENVSGESRYYTKGDANEKNDLGYVIDNQIIGITNFKIMFIGYPTIWFNDMFK